MLRNHTGFAVFMLLLLIAPKIPLHISGGAGKSSVSLGIVGLIFWYMTYPGKLFCFPRLNFSHPLSWLIIFAIYACVVSFLSTNIVSIVYSIQYLLYVVLGSILMRRYRCNFVNMNCKRVQSILFAVGIVFSIGIVVSLFTGPIYPHQVRLTQRHWAGIIIQQGIGFAESQNLAGPVAMFFTIACIYLYHGKIWKKLILLILFLSALLATLSRGAIISFMLAMAFVLCLDELAPFIKRGNLRISSLKGIGFVVSALSFVVAVIALAAYVVNKPFLTAILTGFGLDGQHGVVTRDMGSRASLWAWGINNWVSQSSCKMIFGGGFRSSMTVLAHGAWKDAHNVYITTLGDFGVVGLMLFLVSLFGAFCRYVRLVLIGKAREFEKFGLLALLSLSIDNMTGSYFYSPTCLSLLIFTFAVTLESHNFSDVGANDISFCHRR